MVDGTLAEDSVTSECEKCRLRYKSELVDYRKPFPRHRDWCFRRRPGRKHKRTVEDASSELQEITTSARSAMTETEAEKRAEESEGANLGSAESETRRPRSDDDLGG